MSDVIVIVLVIHRVTTEQVLEYIVTPRKADQTCSLVLVGAPVIRIDRCNNVHEDFYSFF